MLLDTRTLEFDLVEVPPNVAIVICNTMVRHDLASSQYNERRSQCERAAQILDVRALRDVNMEQLVQARGRLTPPLFARARHVVTENARTQQTAAALRAGDLERAGALLYASHESLRTDYEVSCPELDTMVEIAKTHSATIGARMTGGGFGGCTVNLVRAESAGEFRMFIATEYRRRTGIIPEIYDGTPSNAACVLDE
jgi:galactokinase